MFGERDRSVRSRVQSVRLHYFCCFLGPEKEAQKDQEDLPLGFLARLSPSFHRTPTPRRVVAPPPPSNVFALCWLRLLLPLDDSALFSPASPSAAPAACHARAPSSLPTIKNRGSHLVSPTPIPHAGLVRVDAEILRVHAGLVRVDAKIVRIHLD